MKRGRGTEHKSIHEQISIGMWACGWGRQAVRANLKYSELTWRARRNHRRETERKEASCCRCERRVQLHRITFALAKERYTEGDRRQSPLHAAMEYFRSIQHEITTLKGTHTPLAVSRHGCRCILLLLFSFFLLLCLTLWTSLNFLF